MLGVDDELLKRPKRSIPRADVAELAVQGLSLSQAENRYFHEPLTNSVLCWTSSEFADAVTSVVGMKVKQLWNVMQLIYALTADQSMPYQRTLVMASQLQTLHHYLGS